MGESVVHWDYKKKLERHILKVFSGLNFAIISFPYSTLVVHVEYLQFVLFLNISVGGGDSSVQQFIGLLELLYTYKTL